MSFDPRIGQSPMTAYEGGLVDRLARGEAVPEHPSACASVPGCGHAKIWHKQRSGRLGPCQAPGCQVCLMFVDPKACQVVPA